MGGYYQVDLIGLGYRTEQVNARVFCSSIYPVITIGRTGTEVSLQWAFRLYVYDYLGGPGYLTEANFSLGLSGTIFSGERFEKRHQMNC